MSTGEWGVGGGGGVRGEGQAQAVWVSRCLGTD